MPQSAFDSFLNSKRTSRSDRRAAVSNMNPTLAFQPDHSFSWASEFAAPFDTSFQPPSKRQKLDSKFVNIPERLSEDEVMERAISQAATFNVQI